MNPPTQGREQAIERGAKALEKRWPVVKGRNWFRAIAQAVLDAAHPQQTEGDEREWTIGPGHDVRGGIGVWEGPDMKASERIIVVPKSSLIAAEQRAEKAEAKFYLYRHGYDENVENLVAERDRLQRELQRARAKKTELVQEATEMHERYESLQRELKELREGLRERGFIVGRNPDGVDDTVPAALLIVGDPQRENETLRKVLKELLRFLPYGHIADRNNAIKAARQALKSHGSGGAPRFPKRSKREASDPADNTGASSPASGDKQPETKDYIWSDGSD